MLQLRGLLSFPVTPFHEDGELDVPGLRRHVRFQLESGPGAIFPACGTGELFSLSFAEHARVVRATVEETAGAVPVVAGIGYGTRTAVELARAATDAGADALLVFPPYLVTAEQDGLFEHYAHLAGSTRIPLILYQRDNAIFEPATAARFTGLPRILGLKDGHGDLALISRIQDVAPHLLILNGMPTAELHAPDYRTLGVTTYSSAVLNFAPEIATAFFAALDTPDDATVKLYLDEFYRPLARLRERGRGYAVSLVKAGLRVRGMGAGPVRPPLIDLPGEHYRELEAIIARGLAIA